MNAALSCLFPLFCARKPPRRFFCFRLCKLCKLVSLTPAYLNKQCHRSIAFMDVFRARKHLFEHLHGQPSRVGVIAAAMIAIDQHPAVGQFMFGTMREFIVDQPSAQMSHEAVMRDLAQRNENAEAWQRINLAREKLAAGIDFLWQGLVLGWQALDRINNDRAVEGQAIIRPAVILSVTEPKFVERREQKVARPVAGKGPSSAVGPVFSGGQANNAEPGLLIAQNRDRCVPPIGIFGLARLTKRDEARAQGAITWRLGALQRTLEADGGRILHIRGLSR